MSAEPASGSRAVFLSYASQDAAAARRICEALQAVGVEVWLDQSDLVGGDAWDAKIRRQIAECALFVPVISASTQARREGYFRLEWKLAAQRTHMMSERTAFLLPIVIDDTRDADADVPAEFKAVQWTRLRQAYGGQARPGAENLDGLAADPALAAFCSRVKSLLGLASPDSTVGGALRLDDSVRATGSGHKAAPIAERRAGWLMPTILGMAVIAGLALWQPWNSRTPPALSSSNGPAVPSPASSLPSPSGQPSADRNSVAVLPFANLSNDPEQEYFSDGLTEEILNALARERDLRVPGRASSFSFKGRNTPAAEIARTLNVSRLVEGSVRKQGTRVRIGVTLTRAADGFSEELGTFTEELTDIFALQDKIARAVVAKITRRTTAAGAAVLTKNPEAYEAYLRGRALQTRAAGNFPEAATQYERAVALDPAFALAWARLAEARFRPYSLADRSPAVITDARTAIDRALAAQPNLPEALIMRANWVRFVESDFAAVRRDLAHAESLQPPTAELRQAQAFLSRDIGDWPEAQRLARESLSLDPQNGDHTNNFAFGLFAIRGDFAEADRLFARAMAIRGAESGSAFRYRVFLRLTWRGPVAAWRLLERAPAGHPDADGMRAVVLVELGRLDEARALIDAVEKSDTGNTQADAGAPSSRLSRVFNPSLLQAVGFEELARRRAEEDRAEALREFERGNRAPLVRTRLIRAEITLGHTATALAALEEWRRETAALPSKYRRFYEFGRFAFILYADAGRVDEALALLREAQEGGFQFTNYLVPVELRPLRADPRFQEVFQQADAWAKAQPDPLDP